MFLSGLFTATVWCSLALGARSAVAQDSAGTGGLGLPIGTHVRALNRADSTRIDGFVIARSSDTLFLAACKDCESSTTIALNDIEKLEIERRHSHIIGGHVAIAASAGLFAGAAVGAGIGYLAARNAIHHCAPNDDLCGLNGLLIPIGGVIGGGAGFVGGIVAGLFEKQSYWESFLPVPDRESPA